MADISTLSSLSGEQITTAQIQAIINQIDIDVANLTRDGKLGTAIYSFGRGVKGTGRFTDRAQAMRALLEARTYYEALLHRRQLADDAGNAIQISVAHDCECP